jgi:probable F420-dependent oxidoreductase
MVKVGVNLMRAQEFTGGSVDGLLELARLADEKGVDEVHVSDHLAISKSGFERHGHFPFPMDYPGWFEPMSVLSAVAAVTKTVRLSTNVLISPVRPALLLAKQIATLDVISHGRADLAFGVSWHEEEYRASNMPFEGRYGHMEEQIAACRVLWAGGPATFQGERIQFEDFYCLPVPVQGPRVPIALGLPPSERNLGRMVRVADGWFPAPLPIDDWKAAATLVRNAYQAAGRDLKTVSLRAALDLAPPQTKSMDEVFAEAPPLIEAGATTIVAHPHVACRSRSDWGAFIDRLVALKR